MKRLLFALLLSVATSIGGKALALEDNFETQSDYQTKLNAEIQKGLVALYLFNETSGTTVADAVNTTALPALNLKIANSAAANFNGDGTLSFYGTTTVKSQTAASKIITQCKASNAMTIEAWVTPNMGNVAVLPLYGPARIVTLSKGSRVDGGVYLGQGYDGGSFFRFAGGTKVTTKASATNAGQVTLTEAGGFNVTTDATKAASIVRNTEKHRLVMTKDAAGTVKFYVGDRYDIPISQGTSTMGSNLANLANDFVLSLGNEPNGDVAAGTANPIVQGTDDVAADDKHWKGKIHQVAIYCKALSEAQVLGNRAPTDWVAGEASSIIPAGTVITAAQDTISAARQLAAKIYRRIVGVNTNIDSDILGAMETELNKGELSNIDNRIAAAKLASAQPGFYNRTVKDFAKRMSNRDHEVGIALNDMVATIIGVTVNKDGRYNAKDIFTRNFYFRGNPAKVAVPMDPINDFILSNNHFEQLEKLNYDLSGDTLQAVDYDYPVDGVAKGQVFYKGVTGPDNLVLAENYDAAGVLTSRAFLSAHAIAGTNRRLIEYSFSEFLCRPIAQWADSSFPDSFVGRDVDRFPTGDHTKFQTTCRGCHGGMDGLRPAFARITFETNFVKHAWVVPNVTPAPANGDNANNNTLMGNVVQVPTGIVGKYNKNITTFDKGYAVDSSQWQNFAITGTNATYFGWKDGTTTGTGVRQFGKMISESKAFPNCMTKRVFQAVCKRDPTENEQPLIESIAKDFSDAAKDKYQLRNLFERVAIQPACLGQ